MCHHHNCDGFHYLVIAVRVIVVTDAGVAMARVRPRRSGGPVRIIRTALVVELKILAAFSDFGVVRVELDSRGHLKDR